MSVAADCFIKWGDIPLGSADQADFPDGTTGDYDSWQSGTRDRFSIVAQDLNFTWANPIVCASVTHTTQSARALLNDVDAGTADQYLGLILPGGSEAPTVSSIAVAFPVRFDCSNSTGSDINLDIFLLDPPSGGNWSVSQLQLVSDTLKLGAHSNGGVVFGANIQMGKVYLHVHYRDMVSNEVTVSLYDPDDGFSLVSTGTRAVGNENTYLFRFGSGYIGDPPGSLTIGDVALIYEPTAQQLLDLHTPSSGTLNVTTANFGTLNVG